MHRQFLKLAIYSLILGITKCDTNYRLNTTIKPSAYSIAITPYFDTGEENAFTFEGEVSIQFRTESNVNQIKIHSEDLNFNASNVRVTRTDGSAIVNLNDENPLEFDKKYTFAYINLGADLLVGYDYELKIDYKGPIRTDLNGFYRNYYFEGGVKKWLGATQMEPTHARKVFPCFDEPDLKAIFVLSIERPEYFKPTLANTKMQTSVPLGNGYVREIFYPTPKMSTYLVAFLVSEFDGAATVSNGEKEFGIYTRPEASEQTAYVFDFGQRVVDALGDFYGLDYYSVNSNLKLDHVALPDFRAGAMENWGLIKYRESLLLYVSEDSTPYYKYRVAQIVAHETTHMWFGNLVTCHWWSDTWLNEGFANYFQDYITALIEPNVGAADMLVIGSVYSAYDADEDKNSVPITNNDVNSPAEISAHFGIITYQKAGAVIRMMHHFLGEDAFKYGLHSYLDKNKFEPSYPDLLYSALEDGATTFKSLAEYPGHNLTNVMSSWISQAGHPIVHVDVDYETSRVALRQERFFINPSESSHELYKIPISYTTGNAAKFDDTRPAFVMDGEHYELKINQTEENWVIFNVQETGLYRVNYDEKTWKLISNHLKSNKRDEIHHLNRAKIVNDLFAFVYADVVEFQLLHEVLDFLHDETSYAVWFAVIRNLKTLRNKYLGSHALSQIDTYSLKILDSAINRLGYEVKSTDDYETLRNRMIVLEFACKIGHQGCIDNTLAIYKEFKENGKAISPSLRPLSYCTGLQFGSGDDYDFLWQRMATTNVANEARTIAEVLGCTTDEGKLRSFLVSMLEENSPIRTQDLTVPLTGVLSNYSHVNIVLDELDKNVTHWKSIYSSLDNVLTTIASALHTEEEFDKFDSWLSSCDECGEAAVNGARKSLAAARTSTNWAKDHEASILATLKGRAGVFTASTVMLLIGVLWTVVL